MLMLRFRQVDVHSSTHTLAPRRRPCRHMGITGILGVEAAVYSNAPVSRAVIGFMERFQFPRALVLFVSFGGIEGLDGVVEVGLHATACHQLRHGVGVEIHIGKRGSAAPKHLQQRQGRACADVLCRHLPLKGEHRFRKPAVEGQIRAHTTQQRHGGVGMGVHKPGQQQAVGHILLHIEHALGTHCAHIGDGVTLHRQKAVLDHPIRGVDIRIFKKQLHLYIFSNTRIK